MLSIPFYNETGSSVEKSGLLFHKTTTVYKIRLTRTSWRSVWQVLQLAKKKNKPDAIEQTDSWLINEQLWRNDLAGLWKSGILEQCDLVSKKSTAAWAVLKEWSWSQAHTWSAACPSQFWVPKDKKEINCWHKSKKIREHSTSRGWENWFCSPEHNLI